MGAQRHDEALGVHLRKAADLSEGWGPSHWGVENNLHWSLDVTFGEDQSRAREKHAAQNLATMRRIIINILKKENTKEISMRRKRHAAALDEDYFLDP